MDSNTPAVSQVENFAGQIMDRFAEACITERRLTTNTVVVDSLFTAVAILKKEREVESGAQLLDEEMSKRGLPTRFSNIDQRKLDRRFSIAMGRSGVITAKAKTTEEALQKLIEYSQA